MDESDTREHEQQEGRDRDGMELSTVEGECPGSGLPAIEAALRSRLSDCLPVRFGGDTGHTLARRRLITLYDRYRDHIEWLGVKLKPGQHALPVITAGGRRIDLRKVNHRQLVSLLLKEPLPGPEEEREGCDLILLDQRRPRWRLHGQVVNALSAPESAWRL